VSAWMTPMAAWRKYLNASVRLNDPDGGMEGVRKGGRVHSHAGHAHQPVQAQGRLQASHLKRCKQLYNYLRS
jgi:hypothetical protein